MKKINTFSNRTLRNEEFSALHNEGFKLAQKIPDKDVQATIAAYGAAVEDLEAFLKTSFSESLEQAAGLLDKERNTVYVACKRMAQAGLTYPDPEQAKIWAGVWRVFEGTASPLHANQMQSSGIFDRLIRGIRDMGDEPLESIGFKVRLDQLEEVNAKFIETDMARNSERGKRELEVTVKLRSACTAIYDKLVLAVNYKASIGNEAAIDFIDCMNAVIDRKKAQVKARKVRAKQIADSGPESSADNAASSAAPSGVNAAPLGETVAQPATHNSVTAGVEHAA